MCRHSLIFAVGPTSKSKAQPKSTNIKTTCVISNRFYIKDLILFYQRKDTEISQTTQMSNEEMQNRTTGVLIAHDIFLCLNAIVF